MMVAMNNRFKIIKFEHGEAILFVNQHFGYIHRIPVWVKVSVVEFLPEFYVDDNYIKNLFIADFNVDVLRTMLVECL